MSNVGSVISPAYRFSGSWSPAQSFQGIDSYYATAFHELGHYAGFQIMPISVSTEPDAVASGSTEAA